jgi:hypothetical protein
LTREGLEDKSLTYKDIQRIAQEKGILTNMVSRKDLINKILEVKEPVTLTEVKDSCKVVPIKKVQSFVVGNKKWPALDKGREYTVPLEVARVLREAHCLK